MEIELLKTLTRVGYCVLIVWIFITWCMKRKKKSHRKQFVLKLLENLRSDELKSTDGICGAFHKTSYQFRGIIKYEIRKIYSDEYLDLLSESCKELGVYSGNRTYPIAYTKYKDISGIRAYTCESIRWGDSTAYSRAREAVLVRLIEKYETILEGLS